MPNEPETENDGGLNLGFSSEVQELSFTDMASRFLSAGLTGGRRQLSQKSSVGRVLSSVETDATE